jgi:hypothetical protein
LFYQCPTYGPIYLEAAKFEERNGYVKRSLQVCEEGLYNNIKYGPLWFLYLKLLERVNFKHESPYGSFENGIINQSLQHISRELSWKIFLDTA